MLYGPALFSLVTLLMLFPMQEWTFDTSDSFLPPLRILVAYGVFFLFGWLLYHKRGLLPAFSHRAWGNVIVGFVFFGLYVFCAGQALTKGPTVRLHILALGSLAAATWCFIYAFLGLFLRYLEKPIPIARYMADASYWIYLAHLPCTIVFPALLGNLPIPTFVKFSVVLGSTTLFTIMTYHYWVRATAIGAALNGRRYPRALPGLGVPQATQSSPTSLGEGIILAETVIRGKQ